MADVGHRRSIEARDRVLRLLIGVFEDLPTELVARVRIIGGLVPEALVRDDAPIHQGTSDADLQVDLILDRHLSARALEEALLAHGFTPAARSGWRWAGPDGVKIEFLCDQADEVPGPRRLADCEEISAIPLPGTGYASRGDPLPAPELVVQGERIECPIPFTGLAGFVLSKAAAADRRGLERDFFDLAYVLIWNVAGGAAAAAAAVRAEFEGEIDDLIALVSRVADKVKKAESAEAHALATGLGVSQDEMDTYVGMAQAVIAEFLEEMKDPAAPPSEAEG
jgi:hypothetical protein